jgi:hypothetical protein
MRSIFMVCIAFGGVVLAGCENQAASFQDAGDPAPSLTLIREQRVLWDRNAAVAVVVARQPECQRRHAIKPTPPDNARIELYRAGEGRYLLKQAADWYLADAATCDLQPAAAPSANAQAAAIGAFDRRDDGRLRFMPAPVHP